MAIDTAQKRASMLNFSAGDLLPVPSGSFDQGDRQTFLGLYSGILAGAVVISDFLTHRRISVSNIQIGL